LKVLLTGFTTFDTYSENSSQLMAERFKNAKIDGFEIQTVILPVVFSSAFDYLKIELDSFKPDAVICMGLAGSREKISLEKVAINHIHCEIPDNEGVSIQEKPIREGGPDAYFATLPLKKMRETKTPFPVEMSFTAGTYLCNYIMYRALDYYRDSEARVGFIHLPLVKSNEEQIYDTLVEFIRTLK